MVFFPKEVSNGLHGRVEDVLSMEHEVTSPLPCLFTRGYQRINGLVKLEAPCLTSDNK